MNLYTLPENQKLIWDTISKVPHFRQMLHQDPKKSEIWFREIIQMYYNKNNKNVVNKNTLSLLNKETVRYMLHTLKKTPVQPEPIQPASFQEGYQNSMISGSSFQTNYSTSIEPNTNETRNFILDQKQQQLNNDFQMRQNEYSSIFEKPKVSEIDFRENIDEDKPIENMDELLKRQMTEREYDIQNINKPGSIEETQDVNISTDVVELEKPEKKVSFSDENNYDVKIDKLNKKIDKFITEFTLQITDIQAEILEIKNLQNTTSENETITNAEKIILKLRKIEKPTENDKKLNKQVNS